MNYRSLLISFILIGLFLVAVANFSFWFSVDNNTNLSLMDDPQINSTISQLTDDLNDLDRQVNIQKNQTSESILTVTDDSLFFTSIWGTVKAFWGTITGTSNYLVQMLYRLGVPPVVFGTIISIIGIIVIFLGWKLIKQGE